MAIAPTGAIYKALTFDGTSSRTFGVYTTGAAVYDAPKRAVEMISIPGRNGAFALDSGRFENIEVKYPAGVFADNEADFAQAVSDFRNFLCSKKGYVRLTDEYNPDEYRMAVYKSGLEVTPAQLRAGEFDLVFECKPQRWLTSGEEISEIGVWGDTETGTGSIVEIDNPDDMLAVKDLTVNIEPIQNLNGYDSVWVGGAGANLIDLSGTFTATTTGTTTLLPAGDYCFYIFTQDNVANYNSYAQYSTDGVNFTNVATTSDGVAYCDAQMAYNRKKSKVTLLQSAYLKQSLQINTNVSGKQIYCVITRDSSKYSSLANVPPYSEVNNVWTPYSNICPITGHTGANVYRTGKNLCPRFPASGTVDGVNYTTNADGSVTASGTSAETRGFFAVTKEKVLPIGDYILSAGADASINLRLTVAIYKTGSTQYKECTSSSSVSFSITSDVTSVSIYIRTNGGNTAISGTLYPMIRLASDTNTTYEPFSDTYTIDLDGTRYGGTLDVTTGALTVTHECITFNGTENWQKSSTYQGSFYVNTGVQHVKQFVGNFCSHAIYDNNFATNYAFGRCGLDGTKFVNFNVWIGQATDTKDQFKQYLADQYTAGTPLQAYLALATPLTYNLTPQEVTLLLGQNNIWADTGNVTVEYGDAPNQLFNPTLFDAHPLLAVEGYGNIYINDSLVTLKNITYGETIAGPMSSTELTGNIVFVDSHINAGDDIWLSSAQVTQTASLKSGYTHRDSSVTSVTNNGTATISDSGRRRTLTATEINFKYGTASTETYLATYYLYWKTSVNSYTGSATLELSLAYDGDHTIAYTITYAVGTPYNSTSVQIQTQSMRADSTASALGHPAYIDLDIGVAWNEDSGTPTSMNSAVELPAELPVLVPGANSITFDNTITDLQITPRWWKV